MKHVRLHILDLISRVFAHITHFVRFMNCLHIFFKYYVLHTKTFKSKLNLVSVVKFTSHYPHKYYTNSGSVHYNPLPPRVGYSPSQAPKTGQNVLIYII